MSVGTVHAGDSWFSTVEQKVESAWHSVAHWFSSVSNQNTGQSAQTVTVAAPESSSMVYEEDNDADQNGFHRLHRRPPLAGQLVTAGVISRGVLDADTHAAVGVDCEA